MRASMVSTFAGLASPVADLIDRRGSDSPAASASCSPGDAVLEPLAGQAAQLSVPIYDIRCLRPCQMTGLAGNLPFSNGRKEACYARIKITNHHFTLGGDCCRVCGIRNDRRTHRHGSCTTTLRGRSNDGSKRQLRQHSDPSPQHSSESGWHGLWWPRRVRVLTRSIGTSKTPVLVEAASRRE